MISTSTTRKSVVDGLIQIINLNDDVVSTSRASCQNDEKDLQFDDEEF